MGDEQPANRSPFLGFDWECRKRVDHQGIGAWYPLCVSLSLSLSLSLCLYLNIRYMYLSTHLSLYLSIYT